MDSVIAAETTFYFPIYLDFFIPVKHIVTAVCEKCCINKVYLQWRTYGWVSAVI